MSFKYAYLERMMQTRADLVGDVSKEVDRAMSKKFSEKTVSDVVSLLLSIIAKDREVFNEVKEVLAELREENK